MILPILSIIAVWLFNVPTVWAVTITLFASIHLGFVAIKVLDASR